MKDLITRRIVLCVAVMTAVALMGTIPATQAAAAPLKILVFPFKVHAHKDLAYLSQAAQEMLTSRLAQPGYIEVIRRPAAVSDPSEAEKLCRQFDAGYAVLGSLSIFGEEVSAEAHLFECGQTAPVMVLHEFGATGEGVLTHIQKLALEMRQKIQEQAPEQPAEPSVQLASAPLWQSEPLDFDIISMSIADVTGDGRQELVAAGNSGIKICTFQSGALTQLHNLPLKRGMKIIAVDAADINGNQRAEIFVTQIHPRVGLSSSVLEWDGRDWVAIASGLKWFLNVKTAADGQQILVGQKQGMALRGASKTGRKDLFAAGIHRLAWQKHQLIPENRLDLPQKTDIYGFGAGDIMGTGRQQTLAYASRDRLLLTSDHHTEVWRSSEAYGGSMIFLETGTGPDDEDKERHYLAQRIILSGSCPDGRNRVVVTRNRESGGRLFRRYRKYTEGRLEMLCWTGTTFQPVWQTQQLSGHVSDFSEADLNNDGRREIVCSLMSASGTLAGKRTARILMFSMP